MRFARSGPNAHHRMHTETPMNTWSGCTRLWYKGCLWSVRLILCEEEVELLHFPIHAESLLPENPSSIKACSASERKEGRNNSKRADEAKSALKRGPLNLHLSSQADASVDAGEAIAVIEALISALDDENGEIKAEGNLFNSAILSAQSGNTVVGVYLGACLDKQETASDTLGQAVEHITTSGAIPHCPLPWRMLLVALPSLTAKRSRTLLYKTSILISQCVTCRVTDILASFVSSCLVSVSEQRNGSFAFLCAFTAASTPVHGIREPDGATLLGRHVEPKEVNSIVAKWLWCARAHRMYSMYI
jgi:hypothetical protein